MTKNVMTDKKAWALDESDIRTTRMNRRAMLRATGLAGLAAGASGIAGCVPISTGPGFETGITDSDNGPIVDPLGRGRGGPTFTFTGITDSDNGPITDPGGQGRGPGF